MRTAAARRTQADADTFAGNGEGNDQLPASDAADAIAGRVQEFDIDIEETGRCH
jgi:hypothetical protein